MKVTSKRPYLLRALFEWIVDSELTPYILVAAGDQNVLVPEQYVNDGKIVLNVSPSAVRDLSFDNGHVMFNGRFSGAPFAVEVPIAFVLAIYAKETGEGMMFDDSDGLTHSGGLTQGNDDADADRRVAPDASPDPSLDKGRSGSASHLKLIK